MRAYPALRACPAASRLRSAELRLLPWASSASERVTPPPSARVEHEVERAEPRQRVAHDLACDDPAEVVLDALGGDVLLQQRVVLGVGRRSREMLAVSPLSPARAWAISRSCTLRPPGSPPS